MIGEGSRRTAERLGAYRTLCSRFGAVRALDELRLHRGRTVFTAFEVVPGSGATRCELPAFGYVDTPPDGAILAGPAAAVRGWAIEEFTGIANVRLVVDGERHVAARYGMLRPEVAALWPDSEDPNHPKVGFEAVLELAGLAPGPHELALELTGRDGSVRIVAEQRFEVSAR